MPDGPDSVAIVYRREAGIDAIDQYSQRLTSELSVRRIPASYYPDGLGPLLASPAPLAHILLQYNPFRWGRSGFAPGLVRDMRRVRRANPISVTVMVHEAWIGMVGLKSALIGAWQRAQLYLLLGLADRVTTSTEALARELGDGAVHIPPAANIEPVSVSAQVARTRLGLDGRFVITLFGRANPSRALDYAEGAIEAVARSFGPGRLVVLNLGAGSPGIRLPSGVGQVRPGELRADALSLHLWASDLVLLPFTDGVTTRRGTMMAALAHGRPVLGLAGPDTDEILRRARNALWLTPLDDRRAFAEAAVSLSKDDDRRHAIGEAGRALYEARFDWPVLAARVAEVLGMKDDSPTTVPAL
ncbi:MAG: hypothetical protein ACLP0J_06455 [Solirubrobacteraceae bacterium]